jgi:hypothetical protein
VLCFRIKEVPAPVPRPVKTVVQLIIAVSEMKIPGRDKKDAKNRHYEKEEGGHPINYALTQRNIEYSVSH